MSKKHILVVDDSEVDRVFLTRTLEKAGFTVSTAENGEEGFGLAKLDQPDLILLDCEMPVMNGIDMCAKVKEENTTEEIPVIFLTGASTPETTIDAFEADAENFLSKPISGSVLINQIKAILEDMGS